MVSSFKPEQKVRFSIDLTGEKWNLINFTASILYMEKPTGVIEPGIIKYKVVRSGRRTLCISIQKDGSVLVRAPYLTSLSSIERLVKQKASWIIKHSEHMSNRSEAGRKDFSDGELHLFRGKESPLRISRSEKAYCRFHDDMIEIGLNDPSSSARIKAILTRGYVAEAGKVFPVIMNRMLERYREYGFKPESLSIRSMKSRWGSCSGKGKITLNSELIRLPDLYVEYVIAHELCHLRHHNHGSGFYELLSELFPGWKEVRKRLKEVSL
jgi:predicted metal-dependent hydrolase